MCSKDYTVHIRVSRGFFLARLETGRSSLGGLKEIRLLHLETAARGHIAGFGGVAGMVRRLARNVSPTP